MDVHDEVRAIVENVLTPLGVELVDVELVGRGRARTLRVYVDRSGGIDLDAIAEVSKTVSSALDADDPIPGSYTLEVSSPGVERPLRRPEHFRRAIGEMVSVKSHDEIDGARRHRGELLEVDDDGFTLDVDGSERHLRFDQVQRARTIFEWGPAPKPGSKGAKGARTRHGSERSRA